MSWQWAPGDVVQVGKQRWMRLYRGDWINDAGSYIQIAPGYARPLVVIDPEDREQAGRLLDLYTSVVRPFRGEDEPDDWRTDRMQDALRSLLTSPKPDEPTGLGAVVEDAEGERYVRWAARHRAERHWKGEESGDYRAWPDVAAVRVLFEGVS